MCALGRGLGGNLPPEDQANLGTHRRIATWLPCLTACVARDIFQWAGERPADARAPQNSFFERESGSIRSYAFEEGAVQLQLSDLEAETMVTAGVLTVCGDADCLLGCHHWGTALT